MVYTTPAFVFANFFFRQLLPLAVWHTENSPKQRCVKRIYKKELNTTSNIPQANWTKQTPSPLSPIFKEWIIQDGVLKVKVAGTRGMLMRVSRSSVCKYRGWWRGGGAKLRDAQVIQKLLVQLRGSAWGRIYPLGTCFISNKVFSWQSYWSNQWLNDSEHVRPSPGNNGYS